MSDREFRLLNLVAAIESEGESGTTREAALAWYMRTYHASVQTARLAVKEAHLLGYVTEDSGHLFVTPEGKTNVRTLVEIRVPAAVAPAPRSR